MSDFYGNGSMEALRSLLDQTRKLNQLHEGRITKLERLNNSMRRESVAMLAKINTLDAARDAAVIKSMDYASLWHQSQEEIGRLHVLQDKLRDISAALVAAKEESE